MAVRELDISGTVLRGPIRPDEEVEVLRRMAKLVM